MQEKQVAVLIDGDNISPKYAEYIRQEAARSGRIKIFRLYGSISAPSVKAWYRVMPKYGITPMLQISYTSGKSIADQALTIDAMDILYSGGVDIICLVTSDSDFTKLAYRIKESGKVLIGMGEQKTNESLAQACDEFKVLDLIYQVSDSEEPEEIISGEPAEEKGTEELREEDALLDVTEAISIPSKQEIIEIILNTLDDDWENLASIGIALNKQISGFDARNYGYRNMTQFIKNNADKFELKFELSKDGIHSVVYVKKKVK
ncbi:MAG: NYN domain-containing protein [Lachnospiraceae bacterium]